MDLTSLSVFYGLTIFVGCALNFIILMAIVLRGKLRTRRANVFLASLCLSDMLTCAYSITYHLVHLHPAIYSSNLSITYCRVTQYFVYALAFLSITSLTAVCIDRYLAIAKPFFYTGRKIAIISNIMLAWPWIQSFITSSPTLLLPVININNYTGFPCSFNNGWQAQQIYMIIVPLNMVAPFICIVFSCIVVFKIARRQLRAIKAQAPPALTHTTNDCFSVFESQCSVSVDATNCQTNVHGKAVSGKGLAKLVSKGNFREETRIALATLTVVIGFLFAWTPFLVTRLLYLIGIELQDSLYLFGTAFTLANSAWNPILLLAVRKDLRRSALSLFRKTEA